jgi:hypothetical protein
MMMAVGKARPHPGSGLADILPKSPPDLFIPDLFIIVTTKPSKPPESTAFTCRQRQGATACD